MSVNSVVQFAEEFRDKYLAQCQDEYSSWHLCFGGCVSTGQGTIRKWVQQAFKEGCSHLIIVCDDFSHEDYPVKVFETENIEEKMKQYNFNNMQRIMEIYSMKMSIEEQLSEVRAWHPNHK